MNFGIWIGFVAFVISIYIIWQIRQLVLLLFTAIVLATALNILVDWFKRWRIRRFLAVPLSVSLLLTVLVSFFWAIAPPLFQQFPKLVKLVTEGIEELNSWRDFLATRLDRELIESLPDLNELIAQLQPIVNELLGGGLSFFLTP